MYEEEDDLDRWVNNGERPHAGRQGVLAPPRGHSMFLRLQFIPGAQHVSNVDACTPYHSSTINNINNTSTQYIPGVEHVHGVLAKIQILTFVYYHSNINNNLGYQVLSMVDVCMLYQSNIHHNILNQVLSAVQL
jgi:hypothetical protein